MLRKLLNLNRNDLLLYLGIIGGTFLAAQIVTACALVFSDARGIPMVSGIILPITACVLIAFAGAANVGVSFGQALRFGQTRRRALGLTAGMTAVQGAAVMLLSLLLTALERLLLPALWLALSGADKLVWGEVPPTPEPSFIAGDAEWQAFLEEFRATLYLDSFALDWWWYPLQLAIGLAVGLILGAFLQRFGARGAWILWGIWMVLTFAPQLLGYNVLMIGHWGWWTVPLIAALVLAGLIWSVWSLLHAVVKG